MENNNNDTQLSSGSTEPSNPQNNQTISPTTPDNTSSAPVESPAEVPSISSDTDSDSVTTLLSSQSNNEPLVTRVPSVSNATTATSSDNSNPANTTVSNEIKVTPSPSNQTTPSQNKPKGKLLKILLMVIMVLVILGLGAAAYYYYNKSKDAQALVDTTKIALDKATTQFHDLPADATKASECLPNIGYVYFPKGSDEKFGPWLLVNKAGKVIGVEYMFSNDMFTPIPGTVPISVIMKDSPLYNWTFNHITLGRALEGHPYFEVDHIDLDAFTISPEMRKTICE